MSYFSATNSGPDDQCSVCPGWVVEGGVVQLPQLNSSSCISGCQLCTASNVTLGEVGSGRIGYAMTASTPNFLGAWCAGTPITNTQWIASENVTTSAINQCDLAVWPSSFNGTGYDPVEWKASDPPFRIPFDYLSSNLPMTIDYGLAQTFGFAWKVDWPAIDIDCAASLNGPGGIPGCELPVGNPDACIWQHAIEGPQDVGFTQFCVAPLRGGGGNACDFTNGTEPTCGNFNALNCQVQASFCQRVQSEKTWRADCCASTLFDTIGSSRSIWFSYSFWKHQDKLISNGNVNANGLLSITSFSVNPYALYCDATNCPSSPNCDAIISEICAYSSTFWDSDGTTNSAPVAGVYHAALVPPKPGQTNACYDWLQRTLEFYPATNHSLQAMDLVIDRWCSGGTNSSATAAGDSWSCFCMTFTEQQVQNNIGFLYSSCTGDAQCPQPPADPLSPLLSVVNSGPDVASYVAVGNPVCSNPFCQRGRIAHDTSFVSSALLAQANECPTQTCLLFIAGQSITIGQVTAGNGVYIGGSSLFCASYEIGGPSFTSVLPPAFGFENFDATNVWFWDVSKQQLLNEYSAAPAQLNIVNLTSYSANTYACGQVTYNNVPDWIDASNLPSYLSFDKYGDMQSIFFPLKHPFTLNRATTNWIQVTISGVQAQDDSTCGGSNPAAPFNPPAPYTTTVQVQVVNVYPKPSPGPPAQPPGTLPNGIPQPTTGGLFTPAGIAVIVLCCLLVLMALYLLLNNQTNVELANKAIAWVNYKRFSS